MQWKCPFELQGQYEQQRGCHGSLEDTSVNADFVTVPSDMFVIRPRGRRKRSGDLVLVDGPERGSDRGLGIEKQLTFAKNLLQNKFEDGLKVPIGTNVKVPVYNLFF